eukprot:3990341-Lingulodinium_polyedra.AAC.1
MARPVRDETPRPTHASEAIFCSSCRMWVNGLDQWVTHVAGRKHRRNTGLALRPRFSGDQRFWARQAARSHLQLLYTRYTALLRQLG